MENGSLSVGRVTASPIGLLPPLLKSVVCCWIELIVLVHVKVSTPILVAINLVLFFFLLYLSHTYVFHVFIMKGREHYLS